MAAICLSLNVLTTVSDAPIDDKVVSVSSI